MQEEIFFYYTNDLHSNFTNWPKVVGYLKGQRARRQVEGKSCWFVDVGDHMDRVNPISEATLGQANVRLLNDAGYDIVTLGNNEGITLSHDTIVGLYNEANFDVVCANLTSLRAEQPAWLQPTIHMQSVQGVKVGVIGLTAPFNAFYHLLDWHVEDVFSTLDKYITDLKESVDVIILLSHLGLSEDRRIAERYLDIDVIIGGHTHHILQTEERVNQTILTAAGKGCSYVGEVVIVWDHDEQKLVRKQASLTDITEHASDGETDQRLTELQQVADETLGQPIIWMDDHPLKVDWFENTTLIQTLTDTMKEWTGADIAMLNAGLLLDQLDPGMITHQDIHRICPHPINPCLVELTGQELLEVIRVSLTKEFKEFALKGFGFRGEVIGRMIYAGLEVETSTYGNGHEYVKKIQFNGKSLKTNHIYTVAVADTFTFGRLLPEIAKSPVKKYFVPEFLRDLLAHGLIKHF